MRRRNVLHFLVLSLTVAVLMALCPSTAAAQQKATDADRLGMALEYFQSTKYHEALLIFQKLDKQYKLNPRFKAYMALCYYYEWDYKKAVGYFDKVLPLLGGLSPQELSVYHYAAGESYFQLHIYDKALAYFSRDLKLCYDREKGDIYYRIGLCHMFREEWQEAYDSYSLAEDYYLRYRDTTTLKARLAQIANMKRGCQPGIARDIDKIRSGILKQHPSTPAPIASPWPATVDDSLWQ